MLAAEVPVMDIAMLTATNKSLIYRFIKAEGLPLPKGKPDTAIYDKVYDAVATGKYPSYTAAATELGISRQALFHHMKRIRHERHNHSS
jgi:hypothetical protein